MSWYSELGTHVDWNSDGSVLICLLTASDDKQAPERISRDVLLLVNASARERQFTLPSVAKPTPWRLFIDTAAASPHDVYPDCDGPPPSQQLLLPDRSLRCFVAPQRPENR